MIDARNAQTLPITANDRVCDVLARDESLVEVFVRQAPHFSKLRNRPVRKVMARLVTVSPDHLVSELNTALGISSDSPAPMVAGSPRQEDESPLVHPALANVIEIDVRDDLRSGREPFSRIMSTVNSLDANDVLHLRTIFEPVPLFAVLGKRGFAHESKAHAPDDWSLWFWRPETRDAAAVEVSGAPTFDDEVPADDATTTYLDVRGFGPPEPMMRTLIALASDESVIRDDLCSHPPATLAVPLMEEDS